MPTMLSIIVVYFVPRKFKLLLSDMTIEFIILMSSLI